MALIMKQGDTRPAFLVQLKENVGTPQEALVEGLDEALLIKLIMRAQNAADNASPLLEGEAFYWVDPDSPATYTASVVYAWEPGDLDVPAGQYNLEVEVTWAAGEIETFPNDSYFLLTIITDLQVTPV